MTGIALLTTALLFGGTTLYAFGFAAFVFTALPAETAGPLIRRAFPHFYLFVLGSAAVAGALAFVADPLSGWILLAIAATTVFARQVLMPAINAATDAGQGGRFKLLHGLSVALTLGHIVAAGFVLLRLSGML
ncbi:DUF4149 domain-containing protein [Pseudoponticoccus marisrubri]|uniref:TMEM205-like domain-containing protein n=1 Tax=Pseudoponticoccus marisrubri TaxID=1685382 RepID=A0A0W7WDR1_9RHOB|nr:DUF4149 domain-containing protein [Pseudoponticoccus marisrubri]KUF08665.1 hypothetical protein AVJ23_21565 [Pseudoponticoccus marisrubri]